MAIDVKFDGKIRKIGNSNYVNVPMGIANMLGEEKEFTFQVIEKVQEVEE